MPLFLLHDIFPSGPGAEWFLLLLLLVGLFWLVSKALFVIGFVVAVFVTRGHERLGPVDLRGVKPPSLGTWLIAFVLCALGAVFYQTESLSWIASLVLGPGSGLAGNLTKQLLPMVLVAALVSSLYWTLLLTGARAVYTLLRRRSARDAGVAASA